MQLTRWLVAIGVLSVCSLTLEVPADNGDEGGYSLWPDCRSLPPIEQLHFLPIFTEDEEPGFVDLGFTVHHGGAEWGAMQFSQDKEFDVVVPAGAYLVGLLGDEWPAGTVNVFQQLHAGRLVRLEIDDDVIHVNPSCLANLSSDEGAFAFYGIFPSFAEAGTHTINYVWRQIRSFYFVFPFDVLGVPDPLGLEGRRVFLRGETVGAPIDGEIVLRYTIEVVDGDQATLAGDADADGDVDVFDLMAVIVQWGTEGPVTTADANSDGRIDVSDVVEVLDNWTN